MQLSSVPTAPASRPSSGALLGTLSAQQSSWAAAVLLRPDHCLPVCRVFIQQSREAPAIFKYKQVRAARLHQRYLCCTYKARADQADRPSELHSCSMTLHLAPCSGSLLSHAPSSDHRPVLPLKATDVAGACVPVLICSAGLLLAPCLEPQLSADLLCWLAVVSHA